MGVLTNVLRFPLLSLATDTDTDREKYLPGDALLGRLDIESWEPDRLRSRASPEMPDGMEDGLRAVCILRRAGTELKKKKKPDTTDHKCNLLMDHSLHKHNN